MRADGQEPNMRCDVTRDELAHDNEVLPIKGAFYKLGSYALKVLKLTTGDLLGMLR